MTTTSYHGGSDWGIFANHGPFANWGDIPESNEGATPDYDLTYTMLGNRVVARFDEIARSNDSTASWIPQTSEVIHDINEPNTLIEQYEYWRTQASDEIATAWNNGEIEAIYQH